jgi:hypothetical protein
MYSNLHYEKIFKFYYEHKSVIHNIILGYNHNADIIAFFPMYE